MQKSAICGMLSLRKVDPEVRNLELRKLLIADANEEFRLALAEQLSGAYMVRVCADGKQALSLMRSLKPEVLVVDLMLPELDGISLLQQVAQAGLSPMVLATSRFANDYVLTAAERLGVGYLMVKPCDVRATAARIGDLTEHLNPVAPAAPDPQSAVTRMMLDLGVPTKLLGFDCLRDAVLETIRKPGQLLTKELYPRVARIHGGNAQQVERCIRSAIDAAWNHRDEQVWRLYFTPMGSGGLKKPTNSEMITCLANRAGLRTGENL